MFCNMSTCGCPCSGAVFAFGLISALRWKVSLLFIVNYNDVSASVCRIKGQYQCQVNVNTSQHSIIVLHVVIKIDMSFSVFTYNVCYCQTFWGTGDNITCVILPF